MSETKLSTFNENSIFRTNFRFAMTVISFIIGVVIWGVTLQATVMQNQRSIAEIKEEARSASELQTESRLKLIEIQTQLKSIDTTLIEIKEAQRSN